jgi:hypothetical protein
MDGNGGNQISQIPLTAANPNRRTHPVNDHPTAATNHQPPKRRRRKPTANTLPQRFIQSQTNFLNGLDPKTRLVWLVFFSLGGVLIFSLLVSTTFGLVKNIFFPSPSLKGEQLAIQLNQPPTDIPDPNSEPEPTNNEELTKETAKKVIETWLSAKTAALGPNHDIDALNEILTGKVLSQWLSVAQQEQESNRYRHYKHNVEIVAISKKGIDEDNISIDAKVQEVTKFYQNSQQKKSSDETLRVRYDLIHKEGKWLILRMSVIHTFL